MAATEAARSPLARSSVISASALAIALAFTSRASSIDKLSENIRESFIELHSRDIIGDLRREVCLGGRC